MQAIHTQVTHTQIYAMLRRIGRTADIPEVLSQLPDPVDLNHDVEAMARYGLLPDQLMETLGGNG